MIERLKFLRRTAHDRAPMIARVLVLLLAAVLGLAAQSQPPAPSGTEVGQQQQQKSPNVQSEPNAEITVTGGQSVVVRINAPDAQDQADGPADNAAHQNPPAPIDYTNWIIAAATVGLFVVALLQWLTFKRQGTVLEEQKGISERQATTADHQAEISRGQTANYDRPMSPEKRKSYGKA